jgi:hypothetical protein
MPAPAIVVAALRRAKRGMLSVGTWCYQWWSVMIQAVGDSATSRI